MKYTEGEAGSFLILTPGAVSDTATSCPDFGNGSGFSSTLSRTLNTAVLAPMLIARVARVMVVKSGARNSRREICLTRLETDCIETLRALH